MQSTTPISGLQIGSLILPILVLVVVELSSAAREVDLEQAIRQDYPPMLLPQRQFNFLPRFGRFTFIHVTNASLLLGGIYLLSTGSREFTILSAVILTVLWIALPMLEVEEYDDILAAGHAPKSIYFHILVGVVAIWYIAGSQQVWGSVIGDWPIGALYSLALGSLLLPLQTELEEAYLS